MINKVRTGLMILVGIINFLPVLAVTSIDRLAFAYDIDVSGPDMEILLRHRALMFGILGGFIIYAAFKPALRNAALWMAFISMAGFVILAGMVGGYNASMQSVVNMDFLALAALVVIVVLNILQKMAD